MTGQTGQRQTVLRRGCAATEQADGTRNLFESNVKLLLSSKNYLSFDVRTMVIRCPLCPVCSVVF